MRAGIALSLVTVLVAVALPAQQSNGTFRVTRRDGQVTVAANRTAVRCDQALGALAEVMGWRLRWHPTELGELLGDELVDLSFGDLEPRAVAQLIAIAGGADVVFSERRGLGDVASIDMVVVEVPDPDTANGRERLRRSALGWYENFLDRAAVSADPDSELSVDARMEVASILYEEQSYSEAALLLEEVYALSEMSSRAPAALLRLAECYYEMGDGDYHRCLRKCLQLVREHHGTPQAARGAVLLGRLYYADSNYVQCAKHCAQSATFYSHFPEFIDLQLLRAQASFKLDRPADCATALDLLETAHDVEQFDVAQRTDHAFLDGYSRAMLAPGEPYRAERPLRRYFDLAKEEDDRRAVAFVLIGQVYLAEQRYLQARLAAREARRRRGALEGVWARRSSELWASTLLAMGDEDQALLDLEVDVREDPENEPELGLFLSRLMIARGRYRKAIGVLDLIVERGGEFGDRAGALWIEALYEQAVEIGKLDTFPAQALEIAGRISEPQLRRKVASFFGKAYDALGDVERAADAWRGVLR